MPDGDEPGCRSFRSPAGVADVMRLHGIDPDTYRPPVISTSNTTELMNRTQLEQDELSELRARVQNAEAAANRLLMEKDQWHDSARVAEAELARQRPVVDAAEALVEFRRTSPLRDVEWIHGFTELLVDLTQKVKEGQR